MNHHIKTLVKTLAFAALASVSACDADTSTEFRSSEYCLDADATQPPTETPHAMDLRQPTDGTGPGWAEPSSCFCEDNATGEMFGALCGDGVSCASCCGSIGGWWPGCKVWPGLSGC